MWKYIPLVNTMIQIVITIGLGGVMGKLDIFEAETFVPISVRFVFFVGLPVLVIKALGLGINFYSDKMLWFYILAFLFLRLIALAVSVLVTLGSNWRRKERFYGIGDVVVVWLCMTWISTVIMGIPICTAIFGSPQLGQKYGVLAAISSFIFQLPLMLVMLESYALDKVGTVGSDSGHTLNRESIVSEDDHQAVEAASNGSTELVAAVSHSNDEKEQSLEEMELAVPSSKADPDIQQQVDSKWWQLTGTRYVNRRDVWWQVFKRVLHNPVLWGIFVGFILTLSTVGPTYLNPQSPDFVPGLGWIDATCTWLGNIVSPLSLFAMGMWMQDSGLHKLALAVPPLKLGMYMVAKLVLVPLVMVGLALAMSFDNQSGRAAVLIASLPISLVSFPLGKQYSIGEAVLSANTAVGTVLMLPTVLLWNIVMDSFGLFPVGS